MTVFNRLLLAGVLACSAVAARAADKVIFQLDWLPGGDKSAIYAAQKEGFYAAEGLEVEIRTGRGSSDAVSKLATGAADVGVGGIAALMSAAAESGVPVKAVMAIYSKQPDAIFSVKDSAITSFKQLSGKTVATATFSSSNALWPVILSANDVDPATVKLLKVDPSTLAPMLAQGKVDATINWITVAPGFVNVLKQAGKELSILPWSTQGLDGYGWCVMASDKTIKERPDVLKRTLRALNKGFQFAIANPDAAGADLKALVPEANASEAADEFRSSLPLIQNEISKRDGMGVFEPKLLAATWVWVAKAFKFPVDKVNPENLVDRGFLPK